MSECKADTEQELETGRASGSVGAETVAKIYADTVLHEDQIIWQQITTLMGIQAATLAAGYGVQGKIWAPLAMLAGAAFTIIIFLFMHKVRLDREQAANIVNAILERYCEEELKQLVLQSNHVPKSRVPSAPGSGRPLLRLVDIVAATLDRIGLIFANISDWMGFSTVKPVPPPPAPRVFQVVFLGGRHVIRRAADPPWLPTIRAHSMVQWTVLFFVIVDVSLAVLLR